MQVDVSWLFDEVLPDSTHLTAPEQAGFKREGTLRKALWNAVAEWADAYMHSIMREEWKAPKVLD